METPEHPGKYVKRSVLPVGVTIKKAAEILGIGRPALSNLLNGKASLSSEMAVRLEKAFKVRSDTLLKMQAAYDEFHTRGREREIAVRAYAPSLMDITATQITAWSERIEARSLLSAFIGRLVRTTGTNLTKVDFPAHDNSQRAGWDGQVETDTPTPWIPSGFSGWEFGCSENPLQKAESDYAHRVASLTAAERTDTTFVFVTPRSWSGKEEWAKTKGSEGSWKDVRALDASDLEQWLEQSVPAQSWMAERLGIPTHGISTLDECWERWARVTEPELSKELFRDSIEMHKTKIQDWRKQIPTRPFIITADSQEEAFAFLACAFESLGTPPGQYSDFPVVLESIEALKRATRASSSFVAIIGSPEVEAATAGLHKRQHTIIFRKRNSTNAEPDVALDLLNDKNFKDALIAMGVNEDQVPRYERESGKSPTILRRRLSVVPEIRNPPWAREQSLARKLVPLALAGVWDSGLEADREILKVLVNDSYLEVEKWVAALLQSEQPPIWSIGRFHGIASKIDVLYATRSFTTTKDLTDFFIAAQYVLSEADPALDIPEEDRWAANLYGKTRDHSPALRASISETLVLLAVHGNNLYQERLGIDVEAYVDKLVRDLLMPLNAATWASQQHDLPRYAEAAPDQFLGIVENDLNSGHPQLLTLLRPATGMFGGCPRTGLLWALELLAWKPERLPQVVAVLARLSANKIEDNWNNKPENSLSAIFRYWVPQTAATVDQRIAALETLVRRYPEVGWRICLQQIDTSPQIGNYSFRPHWRNDASGAGQPITDGKQIFPFRRKALDLVLEWPTHDEKTLGDLVEHLHGLLPEDQARIWSLIKAWIAHGPDERHKAMLRERVRRFALTRRGRRNLKGNIEEQSREFYQLLEPTNPTIRHRWLFAQHWVHESYDELEQKDFDFSKRDERIGLQRSDALKEVWAACGYDGILDLCESCDASFVIGWHLAAGIIGSESRFDLLHRLTAEPKHRSPARIDNCISGFLAQLDAITRDDLISRLIVRFSEDTENGDQQSIRLLRCAPFKQTTWRHVDKLSKHLKIRYWTEVVPQWNDHDCNELQTIIDRLIEVNRPRAAFSAVHMDIKELDSKTLARLLKEIASSVAEPPGNYALDSYHIAEVFKLLDARSDVPRDEMAQLEFMYLAALDDHYGIPNLERQLAESPPLFAQAVGLTYKRSDGGQDPPEWRPSGQEAERSVATQAYRLLSKARRIPGTRQDGSIDVPRLKEWMTECRALCKIYGREVVGDHSIGQLLAHSPPGADGIWPCEAVRSVLEEVGTKDIADAISIGIYNARGAHFREEGGKQERELAAKYRQWAKQLAFEAPFSSRVLDQIARSYDRDAVREDADADVRRRLTDG